MRFMHASGVNHMRRAVWIDKHKDDRYNKLRLMLNEG